MSSDSGWNQWLEDPCLFWRPGDYNYQTPKHDPKKAIYTPEQEQERFTEEVENSEVIIITIRRYLFSFAIVEYV